MLFSLKDGEPKLELSSKLLASALLGKSATKLLLLLNLSPRIFLVTNLGHMT